MKIISNLRKIALFAFIATVSFTACNSDDDVAVLPADNSIVGMAQRSPDLSILVQALGKTGLVTTLSGNDAYTVFAPSNTAFSAFLLANNYPNLDAVPIPALKEILLNHVIAGKKTSTDLTTGYLKTLAKGSASATNTLSMFVNTTNGVRLNGVSTVTTPNIAASNGVIHLVDAVIGLPTIVTHAAANPAFSQLAGIVTSASQTAVLATLGSAGPFTVFAPTNDAFTAFNTELTTPANPQGLAGVSAANVTKVLQYHVLPGNLLAANLTAGSKTTALGQTFTLALPSAVITDISGRTSNVTPTDVQCTNGVVHVLSKVLLPTL